MFAGPTGSTARRDAVAMTITTLRSLCMYVTLQRNSMDAEAASFAPDPMEAQRIAANACNWLDWP